MKRPLNRIKKNRPVGLFVRPFSTSPPSIANRPRDCHATPHTAVSLHDSRRLFAAARHEAEALAWTTPFPALFLPALLQEKLNETLARTAKQARVIQQSSRLWMETCSVSNDPRPKPEPAVDDDFTHRTNNNN